MSTSRYSVIKQIFLEAASLGSAEREAFLAEACADDDELRRAVERLVGEVDTDDGFLEQPALPGLDPAAAFESLKAEDDNLEATERIPETMAGYRVSGILGRGGMGVVYRAEQENPRRTVALKVMRPGMVSPSLLRRFEYEAHVLGRLQHPGIAQIFEAGTHDTGYGPQPFFAMELIDGKPLLNAAQDAGLSVRERMLLLIRVCDAVHHAHQRGVIHRDIKPANVLVDHEGQPKILDFGIARATDADINTTTFHTDAGQLLGTVPYMSPEQIRGRVNEVDVRSDVYALGVLAYELVSGRLPYDLDDTSLLEAGRIISEVDPRPLSTLNRTYRGDLETILQKALSKEPERRYQSAAELATDLRHYLNDEPIIARPASTWYQMSKFARRHPGLVGGIAAVFIVLLTSTILLSFFLARTLRAEQAASMAQREAVEINKFLNIDLLAAVDPYNSNDPDITLRDALDAAAEKIDSRFGTEPMIEASLRFTLGTTYKNLGLFDEAERHMTRAASLRDSIYDAGDLERVSAHRELAWIYMAQGRAADVSSQIDHIASLLEDVPVTHPDSMDLLDLEGELAFQMGEYAIARELRQRLYDVRRREFGEGSERTFEAMNDLASVLLWLNEVEDAKAMWLDLMDRSEGVWSDDHPSRLESISALGVLYDIAGDYETSLDYKTRAVDICQRVFPKDHPSTLSAQNNLGVLYAKMGEYERCAEVFEVVLDARRRTLGDDHPNTMRSAANLGSLYTRIRDYSRANVLLEESLARRREVFGETHPDVFVSMLHLSNLRNFEERYDEALAFALPAYEGRLALFGPDHQLTLDALHNVGTVRVQLGEHEAGVAILEDVVTRSRVALGESHPQTMQSENEYADGLLTLGRVTEAEALWTDTLARLLEVVGPTHPTALSIRDSLLSLYERQSRSDDIDALHRRFAP